MRTNVITTWFATTFISNTNPGYRYKQTAVTFINDGSATYDAGGYVKTLNNTAYFRGDACTAKFTVDPTKGDIFAIGFTRVVDPTKNSSSNIQYQTGGTIAQVYWSNSGQLVFNGVPYNIGTMTNNRVDIAIALDMTLKTVKVLASTVIGGPKTLVAEKPFQNITASNLIQLYVDAGASQAANVLAYNNIEFAL